MEIKQTVSPLGNTGGNKPRTGKVIQVANTSLNASKSLKLSSVCVPDIRSPRRLQCNGTCGSSFCRSHQREESARWVPVVSPLNLGLDLPRSHKLRSKRAAMAVRVKLLSSRVLKILDAMTEHSVLQLCEGALASAENFEQGAKRALQGFATVQGHGRSSLLLSFGEAGRPIHASFGRSMVHG